MQSRYYDPEIARFINADSYVSTGQGVLGNNMFAYCGNSPVIKYDPSGHAFTDIYAICYGGTRRNTRTTFSDGQEQSDELLQYILDCYIPTNGYSANAHVEYLGIYSKQSNILADIFMSLGGKIATCGLSLSNLGRITKILLQGASFLSSAYGDIGLLNDAVDAMNDLSDKDYHQYKAIISWTQIDNVAGFPGAVRYTYYYAEYIFLWNDTRHGQEHWFILSHTANISEETHGIN